MNIMKFFATPVVNFELPNHQKVNSDLEKLILLLEGEGEKFKDTEIRDTQGGSLFESNFDFFKRNEPCVQALLQFCHRALASVLYKISDYNEKEFSLLNFNYDAWFHVTRKGGFQGLHNHNNASWSGIYCVNPGKTDANNTKSGIVRFHDPRGNSNYYIDGGSKRLTNEFSQGGFEIKHKAGVLWLFPSYLYHEIFPYTGEDERIVVAFNCMIK